MTLKRLAHKFIGFACCYILAPVLVRGQTSDSLFLKQLYGHSKKQECLAISPDGKFLASGGWDGKINIYTMDSTDFGSLLLSFTGHASSVNSLVFYKDSRKIISSGIDFTARVWNIDSIKTLRKISVHKAAVKCAVPDEKAHFLITGSADKTLRISSVYNQSNSKVFDAGFEVNDVVLSGDSKSVFIAGKSAVIKKLNIARQELEGTLEGHSNEINALDLSPDGLLLASASSDKLVKIWDLRTNKELKSFAGFEWKVTAVRFSPDGQYIVAGGNDGNIKIWEIETGVELRHYKSSGTNVRDVIFSSDNTYIIAATYTESVDGALVFKTRLRFKQSLKSTPSKTKGKK